MKKIQLVLLLVFATSLGALAQVAYNPFTQNIHFEPEPTVTGFLCGSTPNVEFTMGMTTAADATQWQTNPLTVTVCIAGFTFDGTTAASVVTGSYSTNFNWAFDPLNSSCIIGTQNQTLPGTGSSPLFPNPLAAGDINLALEVPTTSPTSSVLSVDVTLQVPSYMAPFNSAPDDIESTQTQTYCPCNSLTSPGAVGSPQAFCTSGDPVAFTNITSPSGGAGGVIEYQWEESTDNATWTNITGATAATYNAPTISTTTYYRRATKRSFCPTYIYSSPIVVTIENVVDAGVDGNTTVCESNTASINLAGLITGEDAGGTWVRTTGTGGTFNATAGTFIPAVGATTSTFTYTVAGTAPCPNDNSVATVNIQTGVDAGVDGSTTVCESNTASITLATLITGEDAGGTWARTTGTGGTFNAAAGTFVPAIGATNSTFTYTVVGTTPCPNDNSIATVNIQAGVDAGVDGNTTVCESNTASINLATLITGEDAGGSWARTTGTGGTFNAAAGTFVPAVGATTSTFTYTVAGTAPCPNDNSVATVNIQAVVDAGVAGNTTVCESNTASISLATLITGEDAGGTWARTTGTGGTFNAAAGTYVPAVGATTSTFTYTVAGTAPCPNDNSVATVNIQAGVDAGVDGNTTVCETSTASISLAGLITGEDAGGTWARTSGTGGTFNAATGTFVPAVGATTSTFTYTVVGIAPCPNDNSIATVNIQTGVDAGVDGGTAVCDHSITTLDLTTLITGEDAGGTWARSSGTGGTFNAVAGTYVPAVGATTSTFTYTLAGTSPCPSDNSVATVTINVCTIMISGNVFEDTNGLTNVDGTGTSTNMPIYANLVDPSGNVVDVVAISPNGSYSFNNVTTNTNYTMVLSTTQGSLGNPAPLPSLPAGWENVSEDCCDNTGNDGTTDGITAVSVGTVNVPNVNFGIVEPMSLGNSVWVDLDQDGIKDAGEAPIVNAMINLYEDANSDGIPDGAAVATTTTDANGLYLFDDLNAGSYVVGVTPPTPASGPAYQSTDGAGEEANPNADGDNNDNGITTVAGETRSGTVTLAKGTEPTAENPNNDATKPDPNSNLTIDFGFYQPITIEGNVFVDGNGPTNVDGTPTGTAGTTPLYVNLVDPSGNVVGVDSVNPNGTYEFTDVDPNTTYTVVLTDVPGTLGNPAPLPSLPAGWENIGEDCCDNTGNDGTPNGTTTVTVGTTDVDDVNFGIAEPMSLGNSVWVDLDQDGIKDAGEAPIVNAMINLYEDANSDGIPDGAAVATTTTDANGLYLFDDLNAGSYVVGVTPPTPASGPAYQSTDGAGEEANPNADGDNNDNGITTVAGETRSGTVTLAIGTEPTAENPNNDATKPDANSNLTVDFGFYQPITIEGNVYVDGNGPTNVDGTPTGIAGTTPLYANLVDPSGNVVGVDPVNLNGTYEFTDVDPNTIYTIVLSDITGTLGNPAPLPNLPAGWENVSEDCCDNTGNDGTPNGLVTVSVATDDVDNANFGIREPLAIGNQVWLDTNKDGVYDSNETPLAGAVVNLYADANNDGIPDGASIATITTAANGLYKFEDLDAGNYIVGTTPPTIVGGSYTSSMTGEEANPNLDVDLNDNGVNLVGTEVRSGTVMLLSGAEPTGELPNNTNTVPDLNSNLTVDFGFFVCPTNFTFIPINLCQGDVTDLTALEPMGYEGGTWLLNNVTPVMTPTAVSVGSYTYTYSNGDCSAEGIVVISPNVPDYTPTITVQPNLITGVSSVRVILEISELLNKEACSDLYILVPKLLPRYVFTWQPTVTNVAGIGVANADWQFFGTANPNFYIWKYIGTGDIFPASGASKLGYLGTYDPNNTDGQSTFSVQIFQGSGGETNQNNNTDSDNLIYFR